MSAKNVTNNHTSPLTIGKTTIPAGKTARVDNWEKLQNSSVIRAWTDAEAISIKDVAGAPALPGTTSTASTDDDDAAKEAIIAELSEKYGIEKTKRTSLENLQKALDEAKAAATPATPATPAMPGLPGTNG